MIFFVQCTFKNEKELKGGIIACTQRAGILVFGFHGLPYPGHFHDIAIATAKLPILQYRDDRNLSVCLPHLEI